MDRIDLLNEIYAGRTLFETQLARLDAAQMVRPALHGGWSPKDMLAHLGWWERRALEIYQELAAGGQPSRPVTPAEVDTVNAGIYKEFAARDLNEVREFERSAYRALLRLVETAPEDDLFDPQRFPWTGGYPFSEWVLGNSTGHYEEHLPALHDLLAETAEHAPHVAPPVTGTLLSPIARKARGFLREQGRDIDLALFDFAFGTLPATKVLEVLARYQNPDGGFSRLEPDIAAPVSNPFATELALAICLWIDAPRDHAVVRRAVRYLEETQDEEGNWRFPPEVYQHKLAPWFQGWQWPNLNPSLPLAGLLKRLGLGSELLHTRVQRLFAHLGNPGDLTGSEFYNVKPYANYLAYDWNLPQAEVFRWGVVWWLVGQHNAQKGIDATHFIELVGPPESAVARCMPPQVLAAQLEKLAGDQAEDGGWPSPYDPHWRKWITIQNLLLLRAHGKL